MTDPKKIRNFCIIAHIDHGKSTLADRMLEETKTLDPKQMHAQVLDSMELEQERGITIKSHAITMEYTASDGITYILNLVDTPGHVDFSYEVSRSLAAAEGALLIVDAAQGVEAQTIANLYLAIDSNLEILPVINKIDLPSAQVEMASRQLVELIGCDIDDILLVSAKEGIGIGELLEEIVKRVPPPGGDPDAPFRALIFDSMYDNYRGAITFIRVVDGEITPGKEVFFHQTRKRYTAEDIGILRLDKIPRKKLSVGEVGYLVTGCKEIRDTRVGDTVVDYLLRDKLESLPGYREPKSMVFSGMFPADHENYENLREALTKLSLNDASLRYDPETSTALGFGFRCGFLGLLHMEIIQERLEREFDLNLISTVPSVRYKVVENNGTESWLSNPVDFPDRGRIDHIEEPIVRGQIITPTDHIGAVMKLARDRRGAFINQEYLEKTRVNLTYDFPLAEVVFDFYDRLKSQTRGYASFDYDFINYKPAELIKLEIMINGDPIDALSMIVHVDKGYDWGRKVVDKLKNLIPRQLFEVAIQAADGGKIVARSTVKALRKNVTAKCYGGDITRKRKLLEKQKEGKKRMKQFGSVEVPQEAFLAILKVDD
ncbi:MAG: translation elongation factor 4 [Candidatus Electryonea clarkiae]|nr:translation elongation factor 4 [Candidatus Electryonea clarkiae]MDP8285123.1 translation elongation factor 4 [Candidatus Electryonea clarkiae]